MARTGRVRAIKTTRRAERREYAERKAAYLAEHPFDQIKIALSGFDEERVIEAARLRGGNAGVHYEGVFIPRANQVHHRNKGRGARLNDERWWMSATLATHDLIEGRKTWARESGFLLPIQADADGRWGDGLRALETPAFMRARAGR